jgi:hypothetical protein
MARRPAPVSYAASLIVEQPGAAVPTSAPSPAPNPGAPTNQPPERQIARPSAAPTAQHADEMAGEGRGRRPLEDKSDPSVLYLHPAGKKALRLYAVEKGCKVHDLLLEAVEEWASARGLQGPWRVPSAGPARRRRV